MKNTNTVSQIYLSNHSDDLPPFLKKNSDSIRKYLKSNQHNIYTLRTMREFIKDNFNSSVIWAYDSLRPYSYKSDLGRFCLLYIHGGWYFDIGIRCINSFNVDDTIDLMCFRDEQRHSKTSWAVAGGIIWSKPKNEILLNAIENIIINCKDKWYGKTPLCPTGPSLFGESIAKLNRDKKILIGDLIRPKIIFTRKNIPIMRRIFKSKFILPDGKEFALVKPSAGGDLSAFGAKGTNNYNKFWHEKSVYKKIPIDIDISNLDSTKILKSNKNC
tara:strand:+ start:2761 stop:3576 length:816 start_codon:yes stop_codon:yes gene_type:complete